MASNDFEHFRYSVDKAIVELFAVVTFGSSGAPTLQQLNVSNQIVTGGPPTYSAAGSSGFRGIASISRTSAGLYVLTLSSVFTRILGVSIESYQNATGIPTISGIVQVAATPPAIGSNAITFLLTGPTSSSVTTPVATDPASGESITFRVSAQNSMST